MTPAKLIAISAGSLVVIAVGGYASCSMIAEEPASDSQAIGVVDPGVVVPGVVLDSGIRMEPPPSPRIDVPGGGAVVPGTGFERPPTVADPRPRLTPDIAGAPSPDLGVPSESRQECGRTLCTPMEQCCPGLGRCVPVDCEDCCDRLVSGQAPGEEPSVGPDIDPWPH